MKSRKENAYIISSLEMQSGHCPSSTEFEKRSEADFSSEVPLLFILTVSFIETWTE